MDKTVYVHFSFRRPSHKKYGIFAVAMYADEEGRKFLGQEVRAFKLWKDQQYICAIQAYEHALYVIWEHQKRLLDIGINNTMLVTDNITLAKWIAEPEKRPDYAVFMNRANRNYRIGGNKALMINVGLMEPRKSEKSHKFCREDLIRNKRPADSNTKLNVEGMRRVTDVLKENEPVITGISSNTSNEVPNASGDFSGYKDSDYSGYTGFVDDSIFK